TLENNPACVLAFNGNRNIEQSSFGNNQRILADKWTDMISRCVANAYTGGGGRPLVIQKFVAPTLSGGYSGLNFRGGDPEGNAAMEFTNEGTSCLSNATGFTVMVPLQIAD